MGESGRLFLFPEPIPNGIGDRGFHNPRVRGGLNGFNRYNLLGVCVNDYTGYLRLCVHPDIQFSRYCFKGWKTVSHNFHS